MKAAWIWLLPFLTALVGAMKVMRTEPGDMSGDSLNLQGSQDDPVEAGSNREGKLFFYTILRRTTTTTSTSTSVVTTFSFCVLSINQMSGCVPNAFMGRKKRFLPSEAPHDPPVNDEPVINAAPPMHWREEKEISAAYSKPDGGRDARFGFVVNSDSTTTVVSVTTSTLYTATVSGTISTCSGPIVPFSPCAG